MSTGASQSRPTATVPGAQTGFPLPEASTLAWYAGMGVMVAFDLIEWPVALAIGAAHAIERHSRSRNIRELAEGVESGA